MLTLFGELLSKQLNIKSLPSSGYYIKLCIVLSSRWNRYMLNPHYLSTVPGLWICFDSTALQLALPGFPTLGTRTITLTFWTSKSIPTKDNKILPAASHNLITRTLNFIYKSCNKCYCKLLFWKPKIFKHWKINSLLVFESYYIQILPLEQSSSPKLFWALRLRFGHIGRSRRSSGALALAKIHGPGVPFVAEHIWTPTALFGPDWRQCGPWWWKTNEQIGNSIRITQKSIPGFI